ncbi:uncharacterized protein LOC108163962 isoform X2 [Drosophila miranda]|uniref:uncharacterized protein LOC108163962 isoform X2 n=1 Tax=Drosophila miranda TaxID=7229 RepID=UPI0007E7B45B|nr:uncharacterized protein LOC108163962 isoform X2 [Drosophila miranda]
MSGHHRSTTHHRKHTDERRLLASRVPPKARKYLSELAVDRELERFMALSSTNSSGTSRSNVSMHTAQLYCTPRSAAAPSKPARCSGRNGGKRTSAAAAGQQPNTAATSTDATVASVPKETQSEEEIIKVIPIVATDCIVGCERTRTSQSVSVEDLRTPTKAAGTQAPDRTPQKKTKNTQTPESAVKSHKRLEWDPAADVGYYKRAVSTSNLSTLERSILEECWRQPQQRSETDLDRLQLEQGTTPLPLAQRPPLASSTFVNRSERKTTPSLGSIRSSSNQSNRSSSRRESKSQSRCTSPNGGSSVASSFDYQSSLPLGQGRSQKPLAKEEERQYTAAQLEKVMADAASRRQAKENKENCQPATQRGSDSSSSSITTAGTEAKSEAGPGSGPKGELDLGVDLLCSLVQARSLSHIQKKHLIRDIAKRISCIELGETLRFRQSPKKGKAAAQFQDMATNTTASNPRPVPAPRTLVLIANASGSSATSSSKDMVTARSNPRTSKSSSQPTEQEQQSPSSEASISNEVEATSSHSNDAAPAPELAPAPEPAPAEMELVSQEWLNPMTQSEIEYEERSRSSSNDTEWLPTISWIELEIKRLQTAHKIMTSNLFRLVGPVDPTAAIEYNPLVGAEPLIEVLPDASIPVAKAPQRRTVAVQARMLRGAQEERPRLIGSLHPQGGQKMSLQCEEQPPAEGRSLTKTHSECPHDVQPPAPPPATPELQVTPPIPPPPPPPLPRSIPQRGKMATPNSSSDGARSESVCSFVQQRQRQFMEHYQNQQQQQLQQLQQHQQLQQQQEMQQQQRIYQKRQQQEQHLRPQMHLLHCPQHQEHHHPQHQEHRHYHPAVHRHGPCVQQHTAPQHYIQMQYSLAAAEAGAGGDAGVYYTAVPQGYSLLNNNTIAEYVQVAAAATVGGGGGTTTTATTTSSSISSILCLSSEMSIPMGGGVVNTSKTTTTTTTHHYDDAMADSTGQRHRRDQNQNQNQKQRLMQTQRRGTHGIAYMIQFGDSEMLQTMSLQDHLQLARPKFCAKSKQRKAILNEMQMLRSERRRELEELLGEDVSLETLDRRLQRLPPPVTSCVRVFTTKEMKAMTSKRCQRLPEVVAAQNREREERRRRGNRLMRDVFNRRMQSRVSKGKISLNHSLTII